MRAFVLRRIAWLPRFSQCVIFNRLRASSQNRYMQTLTSKVHFRRLRRATRDDKGTRMGFAQFFEPGGSVYGIADGGQDF